MKESKSSEEQKKVVCLGELLWDLFPEARHPGGAPANVAYHTGQLGCLGIICSRIGADPLGKELLDELGKRRLTTDFIQTDPVKPTGTVQVDVADASQPNFTIREDVAWDEITLTPQLEGLVKNASALCFGTLAQRSPKSRDTIQQCLEIASNSLLVYDVNLRQNFYEKEWIKFSLERADAVKLNHIEVQTLGPLLGIDAAAPAKFARQLIEQYHHRLVCITRGNRGCIVITQDQTIELPGLPTKVADAVGAGDAFTAALIYVMLEKWPLMKAAIFANRVGALVTTKPGSMPPLEPEYEALKTEVMEDATL